MAPDISKLDHVQLFALWEAARAACDLLDNYNCQPRFKDEPPADLSDVVTWTSAGRIVDDYAREFGMLADAVARRARELQPTTRRDREYRLRLLISDAVDLFDCSADNAEQAFALIDSAEA